MKEQSSWMGFVKYKQCMLSRDFGSNDEVNIFIVFEVYVRSHVGACLVPHQLYAGKILDPYRRLKNLNNNFLSRLFGWGLNSLQMV